MLEGSKTVSSIGRSLTLNQGAVDLRPMEGRPQIGGVDVKGLQVLLGKLKSRYDPEQIWLFGSRARGTSRPDSDWDLMVIVADSAPEQDLDLLEAYRIRKGTGIPADILPFRRCDFLEDLEVAGALPYEVARDGVLLYER